MLIKVCGMREAQNIRQVEALGIDLMGFIFYPKSSRYVAQVPEYLPSACRRVGVFVNASIDDITVRVGDFGLDYVQLHGDERPEFVKQVKMANPGVSVIKTVAVATPDDLEACAGYQPSVDYFLFETKCSTYGGSGQQFDWSLLDGYQGDVPFLITGGIGIDDAHRIKAYRHPMFCGIDLNSRFESAPAFKDVDKLQAFISSL